MNKSTAIRLAKPWQQKEPIPDKEKDRREIALHMAEYEAKHGPVETTPIIVRDFEAIKARSGISPNLKKLTERENKGG